MRILYTGPFAVGSLTESRREALIALGHHVVTLDQRHYVFARQFLVRKLQLHLLTGPGIAAYNRDMIRVAQENRPDLIYVDQAMYLWSGTVRALKAATPRLVHYTSEHFECRSYLYRHFRRTVPLWDAHVVTFPHAMAWLDRRGARRVIRTEFGYDPALHRPSRLAPEEWERFCAEAVFVGHWEPGTGEMIVALRNAGVPVRVWGPGWRRARRLPDRKEIRPVYGPDYVRAIAASKVCLCFLSRWGKNRYSVSRTFEIPAIGGFLLAERTEDHLSYFEEGKEAEFFGSTAELLAKVKYYLANDAAREAIAAAGHRHCLTSGYTHQDRVRRILDMLQ